MIAAYQEGIKRSFRYLKSDQKRLQSQYELWYEQKQLQIVKLYKTEAKVQATDRVLKRMGYLMSAAQRQVLEGSESLVIGGKWAVETQSDLLYIAPYCTTQMPKVFKEQCRRLKIPSKIRPYLFKEGLSLIHISEPTRPY